MGVRGLTSFIARNAERYLHPHELHDCDLVIDGDNLSCNLFKDVSGCNPAFGGDYDSFYRSVINFFQILDECHVRPFVLMDGGYEQKKLKTVERRLRSKIGMVKHLNPMQSKPLFPLMMREVFIEAAKECGVGVMRCIFEADDELAVLARKLNCPVLSYDSDFYIHNVKYIPLVTVTLKVQTKSTMEQRNDRKLRHCEAKNMAKQTQIRTESEASKQAKKGKHRTIKYLDCCLYTIKNLAGPYLKTEMLTVFAALLGNDYVERRAFRKFYAQLGLRGLNNTAAKQQKRIKAILKWLQHETKESAIEKILDKVPKVQRNRLQAQLEGATTGYSCETSEAFEYFGLNEEDVDVGQEEEESDEDVEDIESSDEDGEEDGSDEAAENANGTATENEEEQEQVDVANKENDTDETQSEEDVDDDATRDEMSERNSSATIPEWLLNRITSAELPRHFSDLVHLRMYINNPLVENFLFEDCNEIALKILQYIFTVVNQPYTPELRYLTRVVRLTNVHYKTVQPLELDFTYDPHAVDLDHFKAIFFDLPDHEKIFENIQKIPSHLQLYFLAISFWARKTKRSSHLHLHSLIICLIVLSIIDGKIEPIRDVKGFQKKFGKIAAKARKAKPVAEAEEKEDGKKPEDTEDSKIAGPILKRIQYTSKSDCILVMESLLKYFHINECFLRRHNDFSSTVLHGFSEFQSIFYHLSALNALFNYPFEVVRISQCYNGMFLYNMYTNLKNRPDIPYYVLHYLFHESVTLSDYYSYLVDWCSDILTLIDRNDPNKPSVNRKLTKTKKKIALGKGVKNSTNQDKYVVDAERNSDDSDFNDLNNMFCMLLKAR